MSNKETVENSLLVEVVKGRGRISDVNIEWGLAQSRLMADDECEKVTPHPLNQRLVILLNNVSAAFTVGI